MIIENPDNVALFDMDGTLCDYNKGMKTDMDELKSPGEPDFGYNFRRVPPYIIARRNLVSSSIDWWANLPRFQLGWDVLEATKELEYRIMILTQGPKQHPNAWTGKKIWIDRELGENVDVTMTRDKGLVYGKVLVDDYPDYIDRWLKWRKRGLVIMPAHESNENYEHPQVIRYDGTNLEQVREALGLARDRSIGDEVNYK